MLIRKKSISKLDVDKLDTLIKDVNNVVTGFVELIAKLQDYIATLFKEEYGISGSIDIKSLGKLTRITSYYATSDDFQSLGKYQRQAQKLFNTWQSLRKEASEGTTKEKLKIAVIPAKLSFFYFYNGELCKAVVCLMDYVNLIPEDALAMEAALRWLMFLGETELAEKKLKIWKMDKNSEDLFEATRIGAKYFKANTNRSEMLVKLVEMKKKIRTENVRSFPKYELASFVSWMCSTLSNVHVGTTLKDCEFPDRVSHIIEATSKAESIIRNRVPGLAAYQFDNSFDASIHPFLEGKRPGSCTDYIHLGSTIAWHFEMRRELALVNVATAQSRDAMSAMILNLRIALKSASFFRILQMTNLLVYYTTLIEEIGCEGNVKTMRASASNLLSFNPVIVRCSTPNQEKVPSRAATPLPGQKTRVSPISDAATTMVEELTQQMEELDLISDKPFHPITRCCTCNVCMHYPLSSTFASEYMMAYCMHSDFSQLSLKHFNDEFARIRERDMAFQAMMHRDSSIRPRPNIIQNEIFGLCVVQWLIRKIDSKELVDAEAISIRDNALKIAKYLQLRTMDLYLAVSQLGRQLEFPFDCNFSWMQPTVRKPLVKAGIECAVDIFRAVSPFGNRSKKNQEEETHPAFDKHRYDKMQLEIRAEMNSYGHILYRDWRCRLFPYIGRTSDNAWEAAYAWAESTLIGSRNTIQSRLEKCRKGLVTISGPDRFKTCVQSMPDDMTLVQIAMADNKKIYLIKLHADRDPIIMPLAHYTQSVELMDKFTYLLMEDEKVTKFPGEMSPEEFWKRRKIIDARMKLFLEEVEKGFLDVAANLLMPSDRLGSESADLAFRIFKVSKGAIAASECKEMVYLSEMVDQKSWEKLFLRFCEMRNLHKDEKILSYLDQFYASSVKAMKRDKEGEIEKPNKKYTYLVICPHLSQFGWERLPIFNEFPYVGRQVSIHSIFSQLEAMKNQEKQIPLQIDVHNAYYVLDPENNLGETKRRMLEYINKFNWEGIVGQPPNSVDITDALATRDAFFYFGHGSGSSVMPRATIKQSTCNAISLLMGCGSVRTVPQALGFDGKSTLHDYAMAKCPLIVGCLWTVTDGEIDRFLMRMIDDCFEKTQFVTGVDRLRLLSEAMHEARSQAKLKYLTGAAVVMYGLPVVSKQKENKENSSPVTPIRSRQKSSSRQVDSPFRVESVQKTPKQASIKIVAPPKTPTQAPPTPKRTASRALKPPKQVKTIPDEEDIEKSEETANRSSSRLKQSTLPTPSTPSRSTRATRSSTRTPSRSRQY